MGVKLFNRNSYWRMSLLSALIVCLVYLSTLKNDFVNWDDHFYVYDSETIRSLDLNVLGLTKEVRSLWHPLTILSLSLDYAVWGRNPSGYHLTNMAFHILNTLLVFFLAVKLIKEAKGGTIDANNMDRRAITAGFVTSILFGIHPIHVESVAWISERKDVLCAFFYLLALIAYLSYASSCLKKDRVLYYAVCLAFFILALLSKPMAVTLPFVLLILDYCPFKRLREFRDIKRALIEKSPFVALSILFSFITIWAHKTSGGLPDFEKLPFKMRLLSSIRGYSFYIEKLIMPFNLAPFYPYPDEVSFFSVEYVGSFLFLILITVVAFRAIRRRLFVSLWLYYLVTLLPVIGFVQVGKQAAADRYIYLPSLGPFLLAGVGSVVLIEGYSKKRFQKVIIPLLMSLMLMLGFMTVRQAGKWHDSVTLWSHQLKLFPKTAIGYFNRGLAYKDLNNYSRAVEDFTKAISLNFNENDVFISRGFVYSQLGNYPRAFDDFNVAVSLNPKNIDAYYNRAGVSSRMGNYLAAIKDYDRVIELNPGDTDAYYNRGNTYGRTGNYELAIKDYKKAIGLDPNDALAYYDLGFVYTRKGDVQQGLYYYKRAAALGLKQAQDYLSGLGVAWE